MITLHQHGESAELIYCAYRHCQDKIWQFITLSYIILHYLTIIVSWSGLRLLYNHNV